MAIRMVEGRHLHKCFTSAKEHGEDLPVSIIIGAHPAVSVAASFIKRPTEKMAGDGKFTHG